jgi:hypothetical protein
MGSEGRSTFKVRQTEVNNYQMHLQLKVFHMKLFEWANKDDPNQGFCSVRACLFHAFSRVQHLLSNDRACRHECLFGDGRKECDHHHDLDLAVVSLLFEGLI